MVTQRLRACEHTHTHTHTHMLAFLCAHTQTSACTHTHAFICADSQTIACMHKHTHTHTHTSLTLPSVCKSMTDLFDLENQFHVCKVDVLHRRHFLQCWLLFPTRLQCNVHTSNTVSTQPSLKIKDDVPSFFFSLSSFHSLSLIFIFFFFLNKLFFQVYPVKLTALHFSNPFLALHRQSQLLQLRWLQR